MGRLQVGWQVRVISESLSTSFKNVCWPINNTRETSICSPNRRIRAMHDHSLPIAVLSLPDPPLQGFILVFRTCHPYRVSFCSVFWEFQLLDPRLVSPFWYRLSCFMEPSQARLPRHKSLPCWWYIFARSASSFDCRWLLSFRFSSDALGKHRRVFVT